MSNKSPLNIKIFSAILLVALIFSFFIEKSKTRYSLSSDARKIDNLVSGYLDHISTLGTYLGNKVADNNKSEDLPYINNLFHESMQMQGENDHVIYWSLFSWSNKKNKLMVNTLFGILENPISLNERPYIWRARYDSWKIKLSQPTTSLLNQTPIIPVGIGITNKKGDHLGIIGTGINVKKLAKEIENIITSDNAFILVNQDTISKEDSSNILLSSSNLPRFSSDYNKIPEFIEGHKIWMKDSGSLDKSLSTSRFKFTYFQEVANYPITILVGFNKMQFWDNILITTLKIAALITTLFLVSTLLCREISDEKKLRLKKFFTKKP